MYKKISVRNKNTKIRNVILFAVLAFAVIFGGISLVKFIKGDILLAENSSNLVPGNYGQVLYAYLEAGDTIEATLTSVPFTEGGALLPNPGQTSVSPPNYCVYLNQPDAGNSLYCSPGYPQPPDGANGSPANAKVTINGPGVEYEKGFPEDFNRDDLVYNTPRQVVSISSSTVDSTAPAVWRVKIENPVLDMRFRWEVNVKNSSGTPKPGRIWTEEIHISQISPYEAPKDADGGKNLVYWAQRSDGYRYKITQMGYNGFGSTLKIGAFGIGLLSETGCKSAYGSVEIPNIEWEQRHGEPAYVIDPLGVPGKSLDNLPECSGLATYRIFFNEPFAEDDEDSLPADSVPNWESSPKPVLNIYKEEPTTPQITAYFESIDNYKGYAVIANHDSYYGNATLELDTDGNNQDNYVTVAEFGIADAITKIPLDGTKNNNGGERIPMGTLVKGRVVLSYLGEIHIISLDIEERGWMETATLMKGGIEVERLNGGTESGLNNEYALFWDDSASWLSSARATITPQLKSAPPTNLNNPGTVTSSLGGVHAWTMPDTYAGCTDNFELLFWADLPDVMKNAFTTHNVICPFDKIGHFNQRQVQSWGDNRAIEDWTFDIGRTALLQAQVRDDSYFEYMFVDCSVTDAQFEAYIAYLRRNGASEAAIAAAIAERIACPVTPPPPPPPGPQPNCDMTLLELIEIFGDTARALAFREECDSRDGGGGGGTDAPKTGGQRYYF